MFYTGVTVNVNGMLAHDLKNINVIGNNVTPSFS